MNRVLEVIFRQVVRLLALIVVLPLICLGVIYLLPRSYQATATLFALSNYQIINSTNQNTNSSVTPAQSQASALSGLLQTRSFALSVASGTGVEVMLKLSPSTEANAQLRDNALIEEISHHVLVTAQSDNLFSIAYSCKNPLVAQQVVEAVIQNYVKQSQNFGQSVLKSYQTQLTNAQRNEVTAGAAETQFLQSHANLTQVQLLADPQYTQLHSHTLDAQATVQRLQSTIDSIYVQIGPQGNGANSLFYVQDAPVVPTQPTSRSTQFLIAGGIGLVIALLVCTLYLIIMVRRDHAVYTALDLQKFTFFPIIEKLPHVPSTTVPLLIDEFEW